MTERRTLYSVLGVSPDAPPTVIKAAFRALAKQYHPDGEGAGRQEATSKFIELQEAYTVLSDAARRATYDASLGSMQATEADSIDEEDTSASIDPDEVWNSRVAQQPEINFFYETLASYSAALGNRFRLAVIGGECDDNPGEFAAELENHFIAKYFGDDPKIHILARRLLTSRNRKAAKALNKAVQQGKFKSSESYARTYKVFERLCEVEMRRGKSAHKDQFSPSSTAHSQFSQPSEARPLFESRPKRLVAGAAIVIALLVVSLALFNSNRASPELNRETAASAENADSATVDPSPQPTHRKQIYDRIVGDQEIEGKLEEPTKSEQSISTTTRFHGDAHSVSDTNLCSAALNNARDGWDSRSPIYVSEAEKRGLSINDCRVKLNLRSSEAVQPNNGVSSVTVPAEGDARDVSDINLCSGALNSEREGWDSRSPIYVREAGRRNLNVDDCRVKLGLVTDQSNLIPSYLKSYANGTICPQALNLYRTGWTAEIAQQQFVTEALRRGLTPGVCRREVEPDNNSSAEKGSLTVEHSVLVPERDLTNSNLYPQITTDNLPYSDQSESNVTLDVDLNGKTESVTTITKQSSPEPIFEKFRLPPGETLSRALTDRDVKPIAAEAIVAAIKSIATLGDIEENAQIGLTLDRQVDFYGREVAVPTEISIISPGNVIVTVRPDGNDGYSSVKLEIGGQSPKNWDGSNETSSADSVVNPTADGDDPTNMLAVPVGITSENLAALINSEAQLSGSSIVIPKEGVILPGTYIYSGIIDRVDLLEHMGLAHDALLDQLWSSRIPNPAIKTIEEAVALASIVDAETSILQEKPLVASVLVNRLNKGMKLQVDSTVIYGLVGGKGALGRALTRADIGVPTPYNTYLNDGLPPGPIGNPGLSALAAALAPQPTELLYYVGTPTSGHAFARTLEEHNSNVARWRAGNGSDEPQKPVVNVEANSARKDQARLDVGKLEELLKSVPDNDGVSQSLPGTIVSKFVEKVRECWIIPPGARERKATAKVLVKFNLDGSVDGNPEVMSGDRDVGRSAVAAIVKCQDYKFLPKDQYELWKEVVLNFDPNMTLESANIDPSTDDAAETVAPNDKVKPSSLGGRRVALVIGNAAYKRIPWLENPDDDALAVSRVLSDLGFEVTTVTDASLSEMRLSVMEFGQTLNRNVNTALFYYSGHAIEVNSNNYLLPTDITGQSKDGVPLNSMALAEFIAILDEHSIANKIIILDACRNSPLSDGSRGGLALVRAGSGTFIAYSTEPGSVAVDGDAKAKNSPYTSALVAALRSPSGSIEETFKEVRAAVMRTTNGKQIPWESSSLTTDFSFSRPPAVKPLRSDGGNVEPSQ